MTARRTILCLAVAGLGLLAALALLDARATAAAATSTTAPQESTGRPVDAAPAALPARIAVDTSPPRVAADPPVVDAPADFETLLGAFVAAGLEVEAALADGDHDAARAADERAEAALAAAWRLGVDASVGAIAHLATLPAAVLHATTPTDRLRLRFCTLLVDRGLARARHRAVALGDARRRDELVLHVLAELHADEALCAVLVQTLRDDDLGLAHEDALLDLVEVAGQRPWLVPTAARLLAAAWRNFARDGIRRPEELLALAMRFRTDPNPARRLVAWRHLLGCDDPRALALVLEDLAQGRVGDAAGELAMLAGETLPAARALEVLAATRAAARGGHTAALMTLAGRAPAACRAAYEDLLARDTATGLRAEIVTGLGFTAGAEGLAVARLAFDRDPDPEVRGRALLAITGSGPAELATDLLERALGDPTLGRDGGAAADLVYALENVARHGDRARVERLAARLRAHPRLGPAARRRLDALVPPPR